MKIVKVLFLSLIVLLTACQSRPEYVIDEDTMIELLTDVHMAEGLIDLQQKENRENDAYGQQIMAAVLDKYHVSKADYDTSLVWYSQNLSKLIRIYRHVDENLQERQEYWNEIAATSGAGIGESGDSVSLWRPAPYLVMDESRLTHHRVWVFQTDTTFHKGDIVRWSMHVPDMPKGEALVASMVMLYADGGNAVIDQQIGQSTAPISTDSIITLTCTGSPEMEISQIVASLHLQRTDSVETLLPCVVDGFQLIRLHVKE